MAIEIHISRDRTFRGLVTLGSVEDFVHIFHPVVTQMHLEWLPDIIGRSGLHIDQHNRAAVLEELRQLSLALKTSVPRNKRQFANEIVDKITKVISDQEANDVIVIG